MPKETINVPVHGIRIELGEKREDGSRGGTIISVLKDRDLTPDHPFNVSMDVIESTVLAHACAGVDVNSTDYLEGLETVVDQVVNRWE